MKARGEEQALDLVPERQGALSEAPLPEGSLAGTPAADDVREAMVRAQAAEQLEDLYDARRRFFRAWASLRQARASERARLEKKSELFLKSVASARAFGGVSGMAEAGDREALSSAQQDPYALFLESARRELEAARSEIDARESAERVFFEAQIERVSSALCGKVERLLCQYRPRVALTVQPVGADRAMAWIARPSPDDVLLLGHLLSGKLPTRHDAFFDDALDDLAQEMPSFFEEEGVPARPATLDEADAFCADPARRFVPMKAMFAFRLPDRDWPRFRIVNHGPVCQIAARQPGGDYEQLLPLGVAELVSGLFIRLQVEGRLELAFDVGETP